MKNLRYLKCCVIRDMKRNCCIILPVSIIFNYITLQYFGINRDNIKKTLLLQYMGDDKLSVIFFFWLFIQTIVIQICLCIDFADLNVHIVYKVMKIKNVIIFRCVTLVRIFVSILLYYVIMYLFSYLSIKMAAIFTHGVELYNCNFDFDNANLFLYGFNCVLNTFIFVLMVEILWFMNARLVDSYILVQILQLVSIFVLCKIDTLHRILPLINNVLVFFDYKNAYYLTLCRQAIILGMLILLNLFIGKKCIYKFI